MWIALLFGTLLYLLGFAIGVWMIRTAWEANVVVGILALILVGAIMLGGLASYLKRVGQAFENRSAGRDWRSGL
jgi:hypothetical protein